MWVIFIILVLRNNRKIRNEEGREQSNTPENEPQVILGSILHFQQRSRFLEGNISPMKAGSIQHARAT